MWNNNNIKHSTIQQQRVWNSPHKSREIIFKQQKKLFFPYYQKVQRDHIFPQWIFISCFISNATRKLGVSWESALSVAAHKNFYKSQTNNLLCVHVNIKFEMNEILSRVFCTHFHSPIIITFAINVSFATKQRRLSIESILTDAALQTSRMPFLIDCG